MATIVVGIEDSLRAQDAVALTGDLARSSGARVLAVCAYPFDKRPSAYANVSMREPLRQAAEAVLERRCEPLSDLADVRRVAVADPSPARALLAVAETEGAELIVVGSSHDGFHGRVFPGSTGSKLLQGAPCAIAIAPQGHRMRPHRSRGRVTVAFDDSPTAQAALDVAAPLARAAGASLRIVTVFEPDSAQPPWLPAPPGFIRLTADAERAAHAALDRAAGTVPGAEPLFLVGDPAGELTREADVADLLVIGSRGYGPAPAVLLGEVSGQLVQTATCPVLIVPHGAAKPPALVEHRGELLTRAAG